MDPSPGPARRRLQRRASPRRFQLFMNFDRLRKYCATLPGATMDVKWGADECYCVATKMFAVFFVDRGKGRTMSFKCDAERFLELTDVPGIIPAPYLARAHWVQVKEPKALADADACALVARSHALIAAKLTRRERVAIAAVPERRTR
jgi:predicted DNA-binding protein (MmcQ/YjbR family)